MQSNQWVQKEIFLSIQNKWQQLANALAESTSSTCCLITQKTKNGLIVISASEGESNNFAANDIISLNDNVFCKKVVEQNEALFVTSDAESNSLHNVCYCGHPITSPDGSVYGTICILDASPTLPNEKVQSMVERYRFILEQDLRIIAHLNEVSEAAFNDELTGILNRRGFLLMAKQQIQLAIRQQKNVGLLFVDINGLKAINDEHGHHIGDIVIQSHAQQIRKSLRASELAARFGGDEFIILVLVKNPEELEAIQKRLEQSINHHQLENGITLKASIGNTFAHASNSLDLDTLIAVADKEMYLKKNKRLFNG